MHIYLDLIDMVFGDCLSWSTKREPGIVWFAAWEKLILGVSVVVSRLVDDADRIRLGVFFLGVDRLVVKLLNRLPEKGKEGDRTPNGAVVYASRRSTNGLPDALRA